MISGKFVLICLAAMAGLSEGAVGKIELKIGTEGENILLPWYESNDGVLFCTKQKEAVFDLVEKTTKIVTKYLLGIMADDFSNTLLGWSVQEFKILTTMEAFGNEFCELATKTQMTKKHLARYQAGFDFLLGIFARQDESGTEYKNVKFIPWELKTHVMHVVRATFDHLEYQQNAKFDEIRLNGYRLDKFVLDYIRLVKSKSLGSAIGQLDLGLKKLFTKIDKCKRSLPQ